MYKEIIERFIQAQKDARAAYAAAAAFEREQLPGLESYQYGVSVPNIIDTLKELRKFCYNLAGLVVNRARREFSPQGARLELSDEEEREHAGIDIADAIDRGAVPDLDTLWASLSSRYGAGGGLELAYRQAAQCLIRSFGLSRRQEVQRTASAVILRKSVHSEGVYGRTGVRKIGFSGGRQTAVHCLAALETFAAKAGAADLAMRLDRFDLSGLEFTYRQKERFPGMDLVFYKDYWEFKLSHDLADQLMLFIGEYGASFMDERD
ncbi:hypothetical protein [Cupriavidus sp. 8B]